MRAECRNCGWPDCQHDDERCYYGVSAPCETPVLETTVVRRSARIAAVVTLALSMAYLGAALTRWAP